MKIYRRLIGLIASVSLASPALADVRTAAFTSSADRSSSQASMFVGATFSLGLNGNSRIPRYRASLGISGMARNAGTFEFRVGQGLELSIGAREKPALHLAGVDAGKIWRTAKLDGGGKTALIVVGVAAVLGVGALVALDAVRCEEEDGGPCD